jgi:hypothetical protein
MRIIVPDFTAPSKNSAVELIVPVEAAAVRAGVSEHCENPKKPQKSSAGASEIVHGSEYMSWRDDFAAGNRVLP